MVRLPVWPAAGSNEGRRQRQNALTGARARPEVTAKLERATQIMREDSPPLEALASAMVELDAYLEALSAVAGIEARCTAGCSACCTDVPPTYPLEAAAIIAALDREVGGDGPARLVAATSSADALDELAAAEGVALDVHDPEYRAIALRFRAQRTPCALLEDDGRCSVYTVRPLACRTYVSVEDPTHCDPAHPRFLDAERPPRWATPHEFKLELAIAERGTDAGVGSVPLPLPVALRRAAGLKPR